jgi:hypothetical protein
MMDDKTRELISRLFIADADGGGFTEGEAGYYDQTKACAIVGELRKHLESTGQWDWNVDAEPILDAEEENDK